MNRKEYKHQWYLDHKDLTVQRAKQWAQNHPEKQKEHIKKMNSKQLTWTPTRKRIYIKNPRTGVCLSCGYEGQTHLHHTQYHDNDPTKDTIELCPRCHRLQHIHLTRSQDKE